MTLPKLVRERLGLRKGVKIDIFPTLDGGFIGQPKRKSNIMQFAGSLAHLDDGRSWKEIRAETEKLAAEEIATGFERLTARQSAQLYRIKLK